MAVYVLYPMTSGCETGRYGSTCSEECHCAFEVFCNSSIGCPDGPCADGYSGKNCQDGRTNVSLIIPESNQGALVTITCIVQANPIPNEEDIRVLNNDDVSLVSGVFTVTEDTYTRTVVYSDVNVTKGDVFKCQVSSNVSGDAHDEKSVTIYDPPVLTTPPTVTASYSIGTVSWNQWTDTGDGNGDGPVIGYYLCYAMTGNSSLLPCIENGLYLTATFDIIGFQRGIDYHFGVRAERQGSLGTGPVSPLTSITIPCLSPEVAPSIVTVSSLSTSEIQVNWQLIDSEHWRCNSLDYYTVEYKQSEGESFQELNVSSTETVATISNLDSCTTYHIQVTATNSAGGGPSSDIVTVTTDTQAPGKVSVINVETVPLKSKRLYLSWSAPDVVYCPIVEYKIEYKHTLIDQCLSSDIGEYKVKIVDGAEIMTTLSGLIPFTTYEVMVSAGVVGRNGDKIFTPGQLGFGYTGPADATAPPSNITYNNTMNARSLHFSWEEIPCGERKGVIETYKYTLKKNSSVVKKSAVESRFVKIINLIPCTLYTFMVAGKGPGDRGPYSDGIEARTIAEVPESVNNSVVQETKLVWDRPPPFTCDIVRYHIDANLIKKDQCQETDVNKSFTEPDAELELSRLEPYSTYRVAISAETDAGLGPQTTHEFTTPEQAPTRGPKEVNITAVSETWASFAWSEIECGYRRGPIIGYKFSIQTADGQEDIITDINTAEHECDVYNLKPFTGYIFSVKGYNLGGDSESKDLQITTNESIPTVSRKIKIVNTDTESFRIKWSRPEPPNGIVISYQLNYTVVDGLENIPQSLQFNVSDEERDNIDFSYTVENLQEKTNYSVQAAAFTSVGIGPWSDELFVFTITGKPGYVHNLSVLYAQEKAINISWEQPLNPNGVITNYYVQYRLLEKVFEPDAEIQLFAQIELDGHVETYLLTSLEPATKYEIQVFAKTSAGKGEPMNITNTTLTPPVTEQPKMSIVSTTDTTVTVNLKPIPNFIYVRNYVILVEKKTGAKRRDVVGTQHPTYQDSPDDYVTASFPRDSVPREFTVGDGKTYGGYHNGPLVKNTLYNLLFVVDNGELQTEGAEGQDVKPGEDPPVGLIVGLVFLFLLAIVVAAMVITLKRRRGFRAKPMYPMKTIPKDSCIPHVPSDDTLADIVNDNNPPIAPKPENRKAARVHRPVKIEHLVAYVKKKRMNKSEGFLHDFESLPDQQMYSWDVAKKSGNKTKNRYENIVAWLQTKECLHRNTRSKHCFCTRYMENGLARMFLRHCHGYQSV